MLKRQTRADQFRPLDQADRFGARCADLWDGAAGRARDLGALEPSSLTVETGTGAVVAVRGDDQLLVGVVPPGVPPSVARYDLERRLDL